MVMWLLLGIGGVICKAYSGIKPGDWDILKGPFAILESFDS